MVAGIPARMLRILLADDQATNRAALHGLLRRLGHEVDSVGDGRAAIEAVEARGYDLVLMDVQMPEMDGLEASRRLRGRRPGGAGPRIVAHTADAGPEVRARCHAAGIDDVLAKPARLAELVSVLERWFGPDPA